MPRSKGHLPTFENGEYKRTSPSQISTFELCPRSWYYEKIEKRPKKVFKSQTLGVELHAELEAYLTSSQDRFGSILRPAKKFFPEPGPGVVAEGDLSPPLVSVGVQIIGYYDWLNARDRDEIEIGDLKSRSDIVKYKVTEADLEKDPQGVIYSAWAATQYPEAKRIRFTHIYAQTRGAKIADRVSIVAPLAVWTERLLTVKQRIEEIKTVSKITSAAEVPYAKDTEACKKYGGCSFQDFCPHSPARRFAMSLFDDESPPSAPVTTPVAPAVTKPDPHPTDGPGWKLVECGVCGMPMTSQGKRPPGHKIDPSFCDNVKSHEAAQSAQKPLGAQLGAVGVVPPDAPKSDPLKAAEPLPGPETAEAPKKTRGRPKKSADPVADLATEAKAPVEAVKNADPIVDIKAAAEGLKFLKLYIDCAPIGRAYETLDLLAVKYAAKIAEKTGGIDIQLSEHDLCKYGKWKATLGVAVREYPPTGEIVAFTASGELSRAALDALIPIASEIVRGMR